MSSEGGPPSLFGNNEKRRRDEPGVDKDPVEGMRVAGVTTIEQANEYLNNHYLPWWEREMAVEAANSDDAHRALEKCHNLAASLSHVATGARHESGSQAARHPSQ